MVQNTMKKIKTEGPSSSFNPYGMFFHLSPFTSHLVLHEPVLAVAQTKQLTATKEEENLVIPNQFP